MKTPLAALALVIGLAVGLVGWFSAGYRAAQSEDRRRQEALLRLTDTRANDVAKQLRAALRQIERVENSRPYYEFSNLFHDPRGAAQGLAVAPSPLASGPADPLVRTYFQITRRPSGTWRVSMPTINDDLPQLSNIVSGDEALRQQLTQAAPTIVAAVTARPTAPATDPGLTVAANAPPNKKVRQPQQPRVTSNDDDNRNVTQQIQLTPDQYQQNTNPNDVYIQAQRDAVPVQQVPVQQVRSATSQTSLAASTGTLPAAPPLMVTMYAYEAKVLLLGAKPTMMALRRVVTPDGELTQGITFDGDAIDAWLAERAPGATLSTAPPSAGRAHATLAWTDQVATSPAIAATARTDRDSPPSPTADSPWLVTLPYPSVAQQSDARVADFLRSFTPLALLVTACGGLAIWVLLRTDRLARQQARFAASAAHELRTPLAGLQLYGDMLADNLGDPTKAPTYARRVSDEAARLGRVVSNMLGVSQLERGNIHVTVTTADLASVVRDVIAALGPGLQANGATVTLHSDSVVSARFDRDAVTRIVGNLLDNAEKYSRQAGREITCTVAPTPTGAVVRISDQGPGVRMPTRKLFRPFTRGTAADSPAGLGLGLALSRTLARAMGGDLTYRRNSDDTVTEFELTLPA
ncbi:MAG: HAMP domain-containing histidine kinase [Kofleriaceae bacterium]|nr:HAMP domain-containing histidine kinase [Kofleriaceae bacterium]